MSALSDYLSRTIRDIGRAVGHEASYAISDIRRTHEQAAYGRPITPSHSQNHLSRLTDLSSQQARYQELYGGQERVEGTRAITQQLPQSLKQANPETDLYGIGTAGDERSNWETTRDAAHELYGSTAAAGGTDLSAQQARFEELFGAFDLDAIDHDPSIDR